MQHRHIPTLMACIAATLVTVGMMTSQAPLRGAQIGFVVAMPFLPDLPVWAALRRLSGTGFSMIIGGFVPGAFLLFALRRPGATPAGRSTVITEAAVAPDLGPDFIR